MKKAVTD